MKKLILMLLVALFIGAPVALAQNCHVQPGDSLYKIARRYNVDFYQVLELNKRLKNRDLIHPRQRVEIPADSGVDTTTQNSKANHDNTTNSDVNAATDEIHAVLNIVNQERQKHGLKALQLDETLNRVALVKSKDMAENNYFSHDSPTYGSPFDLMHAFGVDYKSAGENIAAGQKTANDVMNDWLNSSGHRANILNANYTHLGVGYYNGGNLAPYWTQEFIQK